MKKAMEEDLQIRAQKFVDDLLNEGAKTACDETTFDLNDNENLPPFYDEVKYRRGQQFYHKHIFCMFLGKIQGLLSLLAIPSVVKLLMHTKMSSEPMTAYKRYMATIYHMCIWYDEEFKPGSKLWQSIADVKTRHNSASKRGCTGGLGRISQRDMAVTQFGFMGFIIIRSELIGIHNINKQELEGFVHMWKVIGSILGIQDRFNLCRDSLEETKEICSIIAEKILKPAVESKHSDFMSMSSALLNGMWCMNPALDVNIFLNFLYKLLSHPNGTKPSQFLPLNIIQYLFYKYMVLTMFLMKFDIIRRYYNFLQYFTLWLMPRLPFLAYYSFGTANSHVTILQPNERKKA